MDLQETAALMTILLPTVAALVVMTAGKDLKYIKKIAYSTAVFLSLSSLAVVLEGTERFFISVPEALWIFVLFLEILLAAIFLYYAVKLKSIIIGVAAVIEVALSVMASSHSDQPFSVDALSMMLILITSLIGSVILIYSLRYMREDKRKKEFFAVIFVFLAAMNGAAISNDASWFILFWGITSLCSFLLMGHTGTPEAKKAARLALAINLSGGAALATGMYLARMYSSGDLLSFNSSAMAVPAVFLIAAAMTKSAQFPVQSWLPGAMAAPVPVSALLHSSTMVNLGVYLLIRISQVFADSPALSSGVAFIGLTSFVAAAVLAAAQSNSKRLLAYSTISNLGLIVMCAGIAQPHSIMAGIILLLYHAVSKALLFLTVGGVKEKIGSENIEDMRSLRSHSLFLASVLVTGIIAITLPPFGVFASKWMIVGASATNPGIIIPLAIGLGITSLYYFKWIGLLISPADVLTKDSQPKEYKAALSTLTVSIIILSLLIIPIAQEVARVTSDFLNISPDLFTIELSGGFLPIAVILLVSLLSLSAYFVPVRGIHVRGYACGEESTYIAHGEYYLNDEKQRLFTRLVYVVSIFIFITMAVTEVI